MIEYDWATKCEWGCTNEQHIWYNVTTEKFHFSNECSQFDETGYEWMADCKEALDKYCLTLK